MCAAKSSPYSKSNSSCPLFSAGHAVMEAAAAGVAEDFRAELLIYQQAGIVFGHALLDGGFESVVDNLLGGGNLRGLVRAQVAVPAKHTGLKRTAMVEGKNVKGMVESTRGHGLLLGMAIAANEVVGGAVVLQLRFGFALKLGNDALGEGFAQLDAPLVKGVDLPDHALGEDAVLVERDQFAQHFGSEALGEEHVGGAVAFEHAMRNEPVGRALGADLVGGFAEGQGFSLGKNIGDEQVVMRAKRAERAAESDEVAGDEARALVDQLIERVLAVGAGLAPVNGAGGSS